jgi:hypothetical protein
MASTVKLTGQIKALLPHGLEKMADAYLIIPLSRLGTDPAIRRDHYYAIQGRGTLTQERSMPGKRKKYDLRLGICRPQSVERGEDKNEIAESIGA